MSVPLNSQIYYEITLKTLIQEADNILCVCVCVCVRARFLHVCDALPTTYQQGFRPRKIIT
jgi:hypothetical protein